MGNELNKKITMSQNINLKKVQNILFYVIVLLSFSLLTYIFMLLVFHKFDFGMVFEGLSLFLTFISVNYMKKMKFHMSKICLVLSILLVSWLIVYDLINFIYHFKELFFYHYYLFYYLDILIFVIIFLQIKGYKVLCKASGNPRYRKSSDWFYEE